MLKCKVPGLKRKHEIMCLYLSPKKVRADLEKMGEFVKVYSPFSCLNCLPNNFCKITEKLPCFYFNSVTFSTYGSDFKVCSIHSEH